MNAVRLSMIYGFCSAELMQELRTQTAALFPPQDQAAFAFVDERDTNHVTHIAQLCSNSQQVVDHDSLEVWLIVEQDHADAALIGKTLTDIYNQAKAYGVWNVKQNFLWLLDEPHCKDDSSTYKTIVNAERKPERIFLLSEKRSDMSISRSLRSQGVAELIAYLSACKKDAVSGGLYTIGFSKLRLSGDDIKHYARHQMVQAIIKKQYTVGETASVQQMVTQSFCERNDDDWCGSINAKLFSLMHCNFCHIEDGTEDEFYTPNSDEKAMCEKIRTTILDPWRERLLGRLCETPVSIDAAVSYFQDVDSALFYQFDSSIKSIFTSPIKAPLVSSATVKELVKAYDAFSQSIQKQKVRLIQLFHNEWESYWKDENFKLRLNELLKQRDSYLLGKQCDAPFMNRCRDVYGSLTQKVDLDIATMNLRRSQIRKYFDPQSATICKESWELWFSESVASLDRLLADDVAFDSICAMKSGEISQICHTYLDSEAHLYKLRRRNDNFSDAHCTKCIFFPSDVPDISSAFQQDNLLTLQVLNASYRNLEELMIVKLPTYAADGITPYDPCTDLTVFTAIMPETASVMETASETTAAQPVRASAATNQVQRINPWDIHTEDSPDGRTFLCFHWADAKQRTVSYEIITNNKLWNKGSIVKDLYVDYVRHDITDKLTMGLQSIRLTLGLDELSRCEYCQRKQYVLDAKVSTVTIDGMVFYKYQLNAEPLDGSHMPLIPSELCAQLQLQLPDESRMPLPYPKVKKGVQSWTFYTSSDCRPQLTVAEPLDKENIFVY